MSSGNPRILEQLRIELATREYKISSCFGLDLLDLDRRIRGLMSQLKHWQQHRHENERRY